MNNSSLSINDDDQILDDDFDSNLHHDNNNNDNEIDNDDDAIIASLTSINRSSSSLPSFIHTPYKPIMFDEQNKLNLFTSPLPLTNNSPFSLNRSPSNTNSTLTFLNSPHH